MENKLKGSEEFKKYYTEIAPGYNAIATTDENILTRNYVKDYFTKNVKPSAVMDFGGGTGLDIKWLTDNQNSVIFCEPSDGMRKFAEERIRQLRDNPKVILLEAKKTDFCTWDEDHLPCDKVDAVLANFNVLNNIADINLLFQKLALIMNDGAHFIATIMDYSSFSLMKMSKSIAYKSLFSKEPLRVDIKSGNNSQHVFIFSDNHLRRAYSNYFTLIQDKPISKSGFRLVHLQKFS